MKGNCFFVFTMLLILAFLPLALGGCGGGGSGGGGSTVNLGGSGSGSNSDATPVGNSVCETCHAGTAANGYEPGEATDSNISSPTYFDQNANAGIGTKYVAGVHNSDATSTAASASRVPTTAPSCETCHGNGSQHYGTGPIKDHQPGASKCGSCHTEKLDAWSTTAHGNPNSLPDRYFFQEGVGTDQATLDGLPEYRSDGTTPVTKNEHIEECSVCHNYSTPTKDIADGYEIPNPPTVRCGSCHDSHQPADASRNDVATRSSTTSAPNAKGAVFGGFVPNLKPVRVNNDSAGEMFGAKNLNSGTWIRPRLYYQFHQGGDASKTDSRYGTTGTNDQAAAGDWLRLSPERLCAGCHTKGQLKYGAFRGSTSYPRTHNKDVYSQYLNSGHANKNASAFKNFSLLSAPGGGQRPQYPFDMGKTDGGISDGLNPQSKNVYFCFRCHNGIASIGIQKGVQGGLPVTNASAVKWVNYFNSGNVYPNGWGDSSDAPILWGDCTVTCISCHDSHSSGQTADKFIRIPKYLSMNQKFETGVGSGFQDYAPPGSTTPNPRGAINKMMDLTEIPSGAGTSIICLLCHQGRDSGWTVWDQIRIVRQYLIAVPDDATTAANFIYNNGNSEIGSGKFSFMGPHYRQAAGLLWSKNSYEFGGKQYTSGNTAHQGKSCTGCHMDTATENNLAGGHTLKPQVSTCQQCHPGANDFHDIPASADYDASGAKGTAFQELGTPVAIPTNTVQPVWGTGVGGTGLMGLLNEALYDKNIRWNGTTSQGSFRKIGNNDSYTLWTPNQYGAGFNFLYNHNSGVPISVSAFYVHNVKFSVQLLIDSLEALGKTTHPTSGNLFATNRPAGDRANTDYRTLKP